MDLEYYGASTSRGPSLSATINPDVALGFHQYAKRGKSTNASLNQTAAVGAVVGIVLVLLVLVLVVLANLR